MGRPSIVVAFSQTFAEMSEHGLDEAGARDIHTWINTGDSAHEAHVRNLVRHGSRTVDGERVPGSEFIDGLGSSEMGMALFRNVIDLDTALYRRCVGVPLPFVEDVLVLDEEGKPLGPDQPGRLAVKTPTVTPGYWRNPEGTAASMRGAYWLTGDIVSRDHRGRFFHLDRATDVIRGRHGSVYSLPLEEQLLLANPDVADGAVIGVQPREGDDRESILAVVRLKEPVSRGASMITAEELLANTNRGLRSVGAPELDELVIAVDAEDLPTGPTGKVLKRRMRDRFTDPRLRSRFISTDGGATVVRTENSRS